ncbi:MAG TPA: aminopeptidase [Actinomycetota bacterium]|jgi:aminopeptidase|nr:aminopeptidase [Actinomycetota bacterium]
MRDDRVEKLAQVLVEYSTRVEKGDMVRIRGPHVAEPLLLALYRRVLDAGGHPMLRVSLPAAEPVFYRHATDEQLSFVYPPDEWIVENIDVDISIIAETNTRHLSKIDPQRQVIAGRARKHLLDRSMQRSAEGSYRWVLTLFPTEAHAMDAEMSLDEYEDFFYKACLVEAEDPVGEWQRMGERGRRLAEWLKGREELHIEGEGTDLRLGMAGRTFIGSAGRHNLPDGEIFTGPVEDQTRGHVTFTYPAIFGGQSVEGIRLVFENGRIVDATAEKNEDYLIKTLDTDEGSRVLGELGIGTNYGIREFSGEILLDEKIGGTVHLAVGASYPETGGRNESSVHWDMVCDLRGGGRITADGETLMEDGRLVL